jgi:integrase
MPLSDPQCRNAKPKEKPYKLADGEGMYLFVQPNGSKLWRMAYRFEGKQKTLAFGAYPYVPLSDARRKRADAKTALAAGRDPGQKEEKVETFASVAKRWYEANAAEWADSHATRVWSRVERDALPAIGHKPVNAIRPPEIVDMLRKVEDRGAIEVAKRLKQAVSAIFRMAIAEGKVDYNPAGDVGDALKPTPRTRHFSTIKAAGVPELVEKIEGYDGEPITRIALLFTLHTFARTNEVRFATWKEVEDLDGKAPLWRIPPERMKMGREHIVPLTPAAVALLRDAVPYREGDFIFPGENGAMSENTMLYALYRLGYHSRQTVHGFRRLASTTLNEAHWNPDWIERQLAHVEENKIRGVYNSAEWLPGRRKMMLWWSDFLEGRAVMPLAA